jgi:hypothetical protein
MSRMGQSITFPALEHRHRYSQNWEASPLRAVRSPSPPSEADRSRIHSTGRQPLYGLFDHRSRPRETGRFGSRYEAQRSNGPRGTCLPFLCGGARGKPGRQGLYGLFDHDPYLRGRGGQAARAPRPRTNSLPTLCGFATLREISIPFRVRSRDPRASLLPELSVAICNPEVSLLRYTDTASEGFARRYLAGP